MTENEKNKKEEKLSCEVCLEDIPEATAYTEEGDEYLRHFCGLDCYQKWHRDKSAGVSKDRDRKPPPTDEKPRE